VTVTSPDHAEIMTMDVVDSPDKGRFEMAVPGGTAFATYRRAGDVLIVPHTEVPPELEGHGYGSGLVWGVMVPARAHGLKVRAACPFVAAYLRRHPEYDDVRA
jgi:predicted GNAT family acetyltransferase